MNYIVNLESLEYLIDVIKIFVIILYTYCIELIIIDRKVSRKNNIFLVILFVLITIFCKMLKDLFDFTYYIIYLGFILSIIIMKVCKESITLSIISVTISLSLAYIMFFISAMISFILSAAFHIVNDYYSFMIILIIYTVLIYIFSKIKRFSKGISFLQDKLKNENMDIIMLNLSIIILIFIILISNYKEIINGKLGVSFIILSIIMFITIQKSLQLYYKQKLQEREVEEIKKELKNKETEIKELEKENLKLNKKNHSIAHKQKSLEYELEQMVLNNQIVDRNHVRDKIEKLSKEMQNETISIELTKTKINEIDNMLKYMQSECVKNKIDFQLQINGNIHHMVNTYIGKGELEILIADLIKNAIIAINHSKNINKSILVRLGIIDGVYSLYVYDSGIEFEIDTLINLGIKPSSTHEKDGGTGMGLMNTFDTLKKYKASLIIDEYGKPVNDNFTKVIKIIFDNKNVYRIESYRKKDIQEKDIDKRIF